MPNRREIIVRSNSSLSSSQSESKVSILEKRPLSIWTILGVLYWFLNSILGIYIILSNQDELTQKYPLAYNSILAFSLKWITAGILSLIIMVFMCFIIRVI